MREPTTMAEPPAGPPEVAAFGDHEVITPDTRKLRDSARTARPGEADQVERAEIALARLAGDFSHWMREECERLNAVRRKAKDEGLSPDAREALFLAAHDVKGYSKTLGYPEVARAAESLCRL